MIKFKNLSKETPFQIFKERYEQAFKLKQANIEAMAISSYEIANDEVDSRFVNLKYVDDINFIFFSNHNSPKAKALISHPQMSALFFWPSINIQIRMKGKIIQTTKEYNQAYFKKRSKDKNALAISSMQSHTITSFNEVTKNFNKVKEVSDLLDCPDYWGGFSFSPYYFEFWEGHKSRLNKRDAYSLSDGNWTHSILQP